jgi:hypothetical protein
VIRLAFAALLTLAGLMATSFWWPLHGKEGLPAPTPAVRADRASRLTEVREAASNLLSASLAAGLAAAAPERAAEPQSPLQPLPQPPPVGSPAVASSDDSDAIVRRLLAIYSRLETAP